jgi:hypothetical protein
LKYSFEAAPQSRAHTGETEAVARTGFSQEDNGMQRLPNSFTRSANKSSNVLSLKPRPAPCP